MSKPAPPPPKVEHEYAIVYKCARCGDEYAHFEFRHGYHADDALAKAPLAVTHEDCYHAEGFAVCFPFRVRQQ